MDSVFDFCLESIKDESSSVWLVTMGPKGGDCIRIGQRILKQNAVIPLDKMWTISGKRCKMLLSPEMGKELSKMKGGNSDARRLSTQV